MEFKDFHDNVVLRIVDDKCYDINGRWVFVKKGNYICNAAGRWVYVIRDAKVYNTGGNCVYNIHVHNPHDEVRDEVIPKLCVSCGHKQNDATVFCVNCGTAFSNVKKEAVQQTHPMSSTASTRIKPKNIMQIAGVIVIVIIGIVIVQGLTRGGNGGLRGAWVQDTRRGEHVPTIEFSGNRFTLTGYWNYIVAWDGSQHHIPQITLITRQYASSRNYISREYLVGNLFGRLYRLTHRGTYSISNNKIELVFSNGTIGVLPISLTENTITIDGIRLVRR